MSTQRSRVLAGSSVFLVKKINEAPQSDAVIGLYLRPFGANNFKFKRFFDIFCIDCKDGIQAENLEQKQA